MRIALLGPANSIHLQRWAWALAERGHRLGVISQHDAPAGALPGTAEFMRLPYRGGAGYLRNARPLRRWLAGWRPQLLNTHYASGYGSTAALAGFSPDVLSVWGSDVYDFPYRHPIAGWWLRRNLRRATAIASTSETMAQQVRRLTPERAEIAITPFGVDTERFAPADRRCRNDSEFTIGIVKSLAPTYGVDLLIEAFAGLQNDADVRNACGSLRLLIVGDGPQRLALAAQARRLGIAERIEFVGAVPHAEVPRWLHRFDVYAAPSRSESFGVAALEAGACGLPVVVSDAGGLPEVIRDGVTGLVVPRGDVAALQAALRRLLLDAPLRARLGAAAREHVMRAYGWAQCVERMERLYERIIAAEAAMSAPHR